LTFKFTKDIYNNLLLNSLNDLYNNIDNTKLNTYVETKGSLVNLIFNLKSKFSKFYKKNVINFYIKHNPFLFLLNDNIGKKLELNDDDYEKKLNLNINNLQKLLIKTLLSLDENLDSNLFLNSNENNDNDNDNHNYNYNKIISKFYPIEQSLRNLEKNLDNKYYKINLFIEKPNPNPNQIPNRNKVYGNSYLEENKFLSNLKLMENSLKNNKNFNKNGILMENLLQIIKIYLEKMNNNIMNKRNFNVYNKNSNKEINLISQIEILEILLKEEFQIFNLNYQNTLTNNIWYLIQENLINLINLKSAPEIFKEKEEEKEKNSFNENYNSSLENLFNKFTKKIFDLIFMKKSSLKNVNSNLYSKSQNFYNEIYLDNWKNIFKFFDFIFTIGNSKWKFLIFFYENFRKNFLSLEFYNKINENNNTCNYEDNSCEKFLFNTLNKKGNFSYKLFFFSLSIYLNDNETFLKFCKITKNKILYEKISENIRTKSYLKTNKSKNKILEILNTSNELSLYGFYLLLLINNNNANYNHNDNINKYIEKNIPSKLALNFENVFLSEKFEGLFDSCFFNPFKNILLLKTEGNEDKDKNEKGNQFKMFINDYKLISIKFEYCDFANEAKSYMDYVFNSDLLLELNKITKEVNSEKQNNLDENCLEFELKNNEEKYKLVLNEIKNYNKIFFDVNFNNDINYLKKITNFRNNNDNKDSYNDMKNSTSINLNFTYDNNIDNKIDNNINFNFTVFIYSLIKSKNLSLLKNLQIKISNSNENQMENSHGSFYIEIKDILLANQNFFIKLIAKFITNLKDFKDLIEIFDNKLNYFLIFFEYLKSGNIKIVEYLIFENLISSKFIKKEISKKLKEENCSENIPQDSFNIDTNYFNNHEINILLFYSIFFNQIKILFFILDNLLGINLEENLIEKNKNDNFIPNFNSNNNKDSGFLTVNYDNQLKNKKIKLNPKFLKLAFLKENFEIGIILHKIIPFDYNYNPSEKELKYNRLLEEIFERNNFILINHINKYNIGILRGLILIKKMNNFLQRNYNDINNKELSEENKSRIFSMCRIIEEIFYYDFKKYILLEKNSNEYIDLVDLIKMGKMLNYNSFCFTLILFSLFLNIKIKENNVKEFIDEYDINVEHDLVHPNNFAGLLNFFEFFIYRDFEFNGDYTINNNKSLIKEGIKSLYNNSYLSMKDIFISFKEILNEKISKKEEYLLKVNFPEFDYNFTLGLGLNNNNNDNNPFELLKKYYKNIYDDIYNNVFNYRIKEIFNPKKNLFDLNLINYTNNIQSFSPLNNYIFDDIQNHINDEDRDRSKEKNIENMRILFNDILTFDNLFLRQFKIILYKFLYFNGNMPNFEEMSILKSIDFFNSVYNFNEISILTMEFSDDLFDKMKEIYCRNIDNKRAIKILIENLEQIEKSRNSNVYNDLLNINKEKNFEFSVKHILKIELEDFNDENITQSAPKLRKM
jgi:hypothetical protein